MGFNKAFEDKKFMIFYVRKLSKLSKNIKFSTFKPFKIKFSINNMMLNDDGNFRVPEIYDEVQDWNKRYHNIKAINTYVMYKIEPSKINIETRLYIFILLKYFALKQEEVYHLLIKEKFDFNIFNNSNLNENEILLETKRVVQKIISWINHSNFFDFSYDDKTFGISDFLSNDVIENLKNFFENDNTKSISFEDFNKNLYFLNYFYYIGFIKIDIFNDKQIDIESLSHGERNYFLIELLLFDKIISSKEKNLIFLLDELENNFHPNWQKSLILRIFNSLEQFKEKEINLIISSHSPFILSDIPKENVVFLEEGKQVNPNIDTFGANIHTLLSHGFFMKDGLMGEFAKSKINEVIDYLNGKDSPIENDDEAQKYIHIIGEPIAKRQLQRMLDSKKLDKMKEIDALKSQIESLQSRLVNLENKS